MELSTNSLNMYDDWLYNRAQPSKYNKRKIYKKLWEKATFPLEMMIMIISRLLNEKRETFARNDDEAT